MAYREMDSPGCDNSDTYGVSVRTDELGSLSLSENVPISRKESNAPNGTDRLHSTEQIRSSCCRRYGRTWVVYSCSSKYSFFPITMHIGPHWYFAIITYCFIFAPIVWITVQRDVKFYYQIPLIVSIALSFMSFTMTALSDPGIIYESVDGEQGQSVICAKCQIRRPKSASHCGDCGVCVDKLDHHCPWTGKCIGRRNLGLFYVFIWCISIHVVLFGVMVVVSNIHR